MATAPDWPLRSLTSDSLSMRPTASLRALGGWTGIEYDDGLAPFAGLSETTDGYYDEALTWLYRHHPQQTHRTPAAQAFSTTGRRIALQRARAASAAGLSFSA